MADEELVSFLISQGHSEERAQQIAGNHPEAVRAEMEKKTETGTESEDSTAPDLLAIQKYIEREVVERIKDLESRHERLVDHVNREIGVAGDVPLVERVRILEAASKTPIPTPSVAAPTEAAGSD